MNGDVKHFTCEKRNMKYGEYQMCRIYFDYAHTFIDIKFAIVRNNSRHFEQ